MSKFHQVETHIEHARAGNDMPEGWKIKRLGEVCSKIGSGATPRGGKESYSSSGISLVRSQNILNEGFSENGLAFIDDSQANELDNVALISEDILLNITGESVARCCMVPEHVLPARVNQHVSIVRPIRDYLNPKFIRYFLISPKMQQHMLALASSGATRQALTKGMIEDFEIPCPSLGEQRAIAKILGDLDEKIELNHRMNKTLEVIAQALFKLWFVEFNFPDEKGQPYKDSGGRMIDSELGEIPEGWSAGRFDEIARIQPGFAFKSADFIPEGYKIIKIANIQNGIVDLTETDYVSEKVFRSVEQKVHLFSGDAIIAMTGAEIGKVGIIPNVDQILLLNQRVGKLVSDHFLWAYFSLKGPEIQALVRGISSASSAQPNISNSDIEKMEMVIPTIEILRKFSLYCKSLYEKIVRNLAEDQTLSQIRDSLLPKLMSGKIKVQK